VLNPATGLGRDFTYTPPIGVGGAVLGAILNLGITHYGSGDLAIKLRNLLNEPTGLAQLASSQTFAWSCITL